MEKERSRMIEKAIINTIEKKIGKIELGDSLSNFCSDSMARIELLFEIEKELGIKISEDDIFEIDTIQDLINVFEKNKL